MLAVQARKRKRLHNKISQNETGEDTNFEIVVKKTKTKKEKPKGLTASEKNARRKQKKKLEKLKEKKEQREERERILKSLEEHAVSSEQLSMLHSSCGRKPNTLLVKEQAKRSAIILNHKKKKKKCSGKLDKLLNPVEGKPPPAPIESDTSDESDPEYENPGPSSLPENEFNNVPDKTTTQAIQSEPSKIKPATVTGRSSRTNVVKETSKPSSFVRYVPSQPTQAVNA